MNGTDFSHLMNGIDCWKYGPKPIELNDKLILKNAKWILKSPTLIIQLHVEEYIYTKLVFIYG